ncbi:MAG: DUF565 domain-containing protein [Elainellaceae cyanobacterium]
MQNTRLTILVGRSLDQLTLWLNNPWRRLSIIVIGLLIGNFAATVVSTTAGQSADNDILISLLLLGFTELTSWFVYGTRRLAIETNRPPRQKLLGIELLNSVKIGLVFGLFVEAFKLGS